MAYRGGGGYRDERDYRDTRDQRDYRDNRDSRDGGYGGGYGQRDRGYAPRGGGYSAPPREQRPPAPSSSGPRPGSKAAGYTLFVGGLSDQVRSQDVAREFERFGQLVRVDIPLRNGHSKGFAFVEFIYKQDCERALDETRGRLRIDGRPVTVELTQRDFQAQPRAAAPPADAPPRARSRSPVRRDRSPPPPRRSRSRSPPRADRDADRAPKRAASRSPPPRDREGRSPDRR